MGKPRDHYLPAAFLGRFSVSDSLPIRSRPIYTYNRFAHNTYRTTPDGVGFKKGLYDLKGGSFGIASIDSWSYESGIAPVLDRLQNSQQLSLDDYIHVAVPFVAGLFVRGTEFNKRYEANPVIQHLKDQGNMQPDNTNISRMMRLERQLPPVAAARWIVMHTDGTTPLITNNLGLVQTLDLSSGDYGWAIPLDTTTMLGIFPKKFGGISWYENGTWHATIEHRYPARRVFWDFNAQLARAATEFIVGPDQATVSRYGHHVTDHETAMIMEASWSRMFRGAEFAAHTSDWATLAAIANTNLPPDQLPGHEFSLTDLDSVHRWSPPLLAPPLYIGHPANGIVLEGNRLYLDMSLSPYAARSLGITPAA